MIKPNLDKTEKRSADAAQGDDTREGVGLDAGNLMVLLTIASTLMATMIGVPWITPILHASAVFPFYYRAMKQHRHRLTLALITRWAGAAFVTTMVLGAFVPSRVQDSLLFSAVTIRVVENWLAAIQGPPPADYPYILWGLAAFLAGSMVSGGLLGFILASVAMGTAASGALFLFEQGNNVIQMMIVAVPPWQWTALACAGFLMVPAARLFFDRFVHAERVAEERRVIVVFMYAGGACFALAVLLRWATADAFRNLLLRWTAF